MARDPQRRARPHLPATRPAGRNPWRRPARSRRPASRRLPGPRRRREGTGDVGAAQLATPDLALIDEELAEHERWAGAEATVGEAGSAERAGFIAQMAGSEMGSGALMGAGMAIGIGLVTKGAERALARYVPVPAVGAIIGGVMGGIQLAQTISGWNAPGGGADVFARAGTGASGYETAANTIEAVLMVLDLAANVLDIISGICGIVTAACWAAAILSLGALSPLAGTATAISAALMVVTTILNVVKMAMTPLVLLFRSLHAFTSQADPREVELQGGRLASSGGQLAGTVGGLAGSKALEHVTAPRPGQPPHPQQPELPTPRGRGPEVTVDAPAAAHAPAADAPAAAHAPAADTPAAAADMPAEHAPVIAADAPPAAAAGPAHPLANASDAEIDAAIAHLGAADTGAPTAPMHVPESGELGHVAPMNEQPRAGRDSSGRRTTENEHVIPHAQLADLTRNPVTGQPDFTPSDYRNAATVRTERSTALEKTHNPVTGDNARTRDLRAQVAAGDQINLNEHLFEPSRAEQTRGWA